MTKDMDIDLEIEADEVAYIYLGTDKHNNLKNLDLPDSHPIRAITGLQEVVDKVGRTEDGAEVNEIVGVKVNGTILDIAEDRTVDVPVPTSYGYHLDLDGDNGIISLKDRYGVVLSTIDTNLERIVKSGRYDADTNELVLVLDDNSEIRIDASKLVDVYTADGETIVESGHVFALSKGSKDALKDSADHIADRSNPHAVTKAQIGLGNVDNTSDMGKPISTLVQQALDGKADDSAVVHKTGDTMTGALKLMKNPTIYHSSDAKTLPSAYEDRGTIYFNDTNDVRRGTIRCDADTSYYRTLISTEGVINGESKSARLELKIQSDGTAAAFAPSWNAGTADNSDKILTTKMANSLPSLVHTTGNETIAGMKTFSSPPTITYNGSTLNLKNTGIDKETPPSTVRWNRIQFQDAQDKELGGIQYNYKPSGEMVLQIYLSNNNTTSWNFGMVLASDGTTYGTAPVTPDTAPDTAIVTKKYLLDKIAALEARISALEGA